MLFLMALNREFLLFMSMFKCHSFFALSLSFSLISKIFFFCIFHFSTSFTNKESNSLDKLKNADCFKTNHKEHNNNIPNKSLIPLDFSASASSSSSLMNYQQQEQSINNQLIQSQAPINLENNFNSSNNLSMINNSVSNRSNFNHDLTYNHLIQNGLSLNNQSINNGPTVSLPEFPNVNELRLRTTRSHFNKRLINLYSAFLMMYRTHCQRILDTLIRCNLSELNTFINYFWQSVPEHLKCVLSEPVFHCLIAICDCILYKCITQILFSPLLQSNLPEK